MKVIKLKDYYGITQFVQVTDEFYAEWRAMEQEEDNAQKKIQRHRDNRGPETANWASRMSCFESLDDILIAMEEDQELLRAISKLTRTQRRRLLLLLDDMSLRNIADQEHRHYNSVKESVFAALYKIRKNLNYKLFS